MSDKPWKQTERRIGGSFGDESQGMFETPEGRRIFRMHQQYVHLVYLLPRIEADEDLGDGTQLPRRGLMLG